MTKSIGFSGYNWLVKESSEKVGPGPNLFSGKVISLVNGELKLDVIYSDGNFYCSELFLEQSLGYGKYVFQLSGRVDLLKDDLVLGLFTWDETPAQYHREIDIEFSKWGNSKNMNSQFVVQPFKIQGNKSRFVTQLSGDYSTHMIEWRPDKIYFYSVHGHVDLIDESSKVIHSWEYAGKNVPIPGNEKIHVNLWKTGQKRSERIKSGLTSIAIKKFWFEPF